MSPEDFKRLLREKTAEEIVSQHILTVDSGPYVSKEALLSLEERIRTVFGLRTESLTTYVVGSAKLGFAILEKPAKNGSPIKPAYRSYQPGKSDIDVAVVSSALYEIIWRALAVFAAGQVYFPWRTDLAPYLVSGWLRPDKFPMGAPQRCVDWRSAIYEVSQNKFFRYKRLRCGIYYSEHFLSLYQQRGVTSARQAMDFQ